MVWVYFTFILYLYIMHRHSIRYNGIQDVAQRNISRKHDVFICHEKAIHVSNAL